jgi:hypothetical protein
LGGGPIGGSSGDVAHQFHGIVRRQGADHPVVIDLQHRREVTRRKTFGALQSELAIGRGLARLYPKMRSERANQTLRADQAACEVVADANDVSALRTELEHVVEGRDSRDLGRTDLEDVGDLADCIPRDVAVAFLRGAQ